jgi:hypothetical protein
MQEAADARKEHRDFALVRGGDHLIVAYAAAPAYMIAVAPLKLLFSLLVAIREPKNCRFGDKFGSFAKTVTETVNTANAALILSRI